MVSSVAARLLSAVVGLAGALTSACGSDGANGTGSASNVCSEVSCHGDPTGSWAISGACARDVEGVAPDCPTWTCDVTKVSASGSFELAANGTGSFDWTAALESRCRAPTSCLSGKDCATLASEHPARSCSASSAGCECTQTDQDTARLTGNWQLNSLSLLEFSEGSSSTATSNWCVRDGTFSYEVLVNHLLGLPGDTVPLTKVVLSARSR